VPLITPDDYILRALMRFACKRPATCSHQRLLCNYRKIFHSLRRIVRKMLAEVTDFNIVISSLAYIFAKNCALIFLFYIYIYIYIYIIIIFNLSIDPIMGNNDYTYKSN